MKHSGMTRCLKNREQNGCKSNGSCKNTLFAGFTTVRDLGTEGAGYDDVGLKQAIEKGIIPGPRMWCATKAIVATGSYGPKELRDEIDIAKRRSRSRWCRCIDKRSDEHKLVKAPMLLRFMQIIDGDVNNEAGSQLLP